MRVVENAIRLQCLVGPSELLNVGHEQSGVRNPGKRAVVTVKSIGRASESHDTGEHIAGAYVDEIGMQVRPPDSVDIPAGHRPSGSATSCTRSPLKNRLVDPVAVLDPVEEKDGLAHVGRRLRRHSPRRREGRDGATGAVGPTGERDPAVDGSGGHDALAKELLSWFLDQSRDVVDAAEHAAFQMAIPLADAPWNWWPTGLINNGVRR